MDQIEFYTNRGPIVVFGVNSNTFVPRVGETLSMGQTTFKVISVHYNYLASKIHVECKPLMNYPTIND